MSDLPYTKEVLRLAADATGAGRLDPPCRSHTKFNPACGDRTTIDLRVLEGRITAVAQDTRACILTQASASILGAALAGQNAGDLLNLRRQVEAMLQGGPPPEGRFAAYGALADAAAHAGRHTCVLLPIEAAVNAMAGSDLTEPGG